VHNTGLGLRPLLQLCFDQAYEAMDVHVTLVVEVRFLFYTIHTS